jgi:predicted AlkP superfamily phosphohydrolase/phosphomutase
MKLAVIGLDCATPQLVFDRLRDELPNLSRLMADGVHGELESCHPPTTLPAWSCMLSSRDPGELGFYGFRTRRDHSYDASRRADAGAMTHPRVWDYLGRRGLRSILLGVPQTYPPRPIHGEMVACFLTPSTQTEYTYPSALRHEVEEVAGGYILDAEGFRSDDKPAVVEQIFEMTRRRFRLARHLVTTHPWDFFMMVEMGPDRIHHGFWRHFDPAHPRHEPGNEWEHVIPDYYRALDREVGDLVDRLPGDCAVMVVSDHGAKAMVGGLCFNEWLMDRGYLTLRSVPDTVTPFARLDVDWDRTVAWADGGYCGRLFMNVKGRQPRGIVPAADYEAVRQRLIEDIEAIEDPSGKTMRSAALRPEEIYRAVNGVAPDLLVSFGNLDWRSVGSVGHGSIYVSDNDTGPDDANHSPHGICIVRAPGLPGGRRLDGLRLFDVAPTILQHYEIPVPAAMQGEVIR